MSNNRKKNIIRITFKSIQNLGRHQSFVTFKSKDKTTPNSLIVNENVITNKNCIVEISMIFLLMLVQILRLEYRKEKGLLKYI